jgi:ribosomal protein L29
MKFSHTVAGTENPMQLRMKRKEVARMLTVLNQRKNNGK